MQGEREVPTKTVIFLDTNVFLQCRALEELPWVELATSNEISLLIARAVQEEIDRLKGDGNPRRSKRAGKTSKLMRQIILQKQPHSIRSDAPQIKLDFAPTEPQENRSLSNDLRLVKQAIEYRNAHPAEKVLLLTDDTGPMVTARDLGLNFFPVPKEWLLPPAGDDKDKQIRELKERLRTFEEKTPQIIAKLVKDPRKPSELTELEITTYPDFSNERIKELTDWVKQKYPMVTDYDREKDLDPRKLGLGLQGTVKYKPAKQEEIEKYRNELYPAWLGEVENFFRTMSARLEEPSRHFTLFLFLQNSGFVPAERTEVHLKAYGNIVFAGRLRHTPKLTFRKPPEVPHGKWQSEIGFELSNLIRQIKLPTTSYEGIDNLCAGMNTFAVDRTAFYQLKTEGTPVALTFDCEEFRHQAPPVFLELPVFIPGTSQSEPAVIECVVSASNMPQPYKACFQISVVSTQGSIDRELENLLGKGWGKPPVTLLFTKKLPATSTKSSGEDRGNEE